MSGFTAPVANIRGFGEPATFLFFEILTMLVADGTGRAFSFTDDDLVTYICTLTSEPSCTEVMRVIEYTVGMDIIHAVKPYLLGNSSRILTQEPGYVLERYIFSQAGFNILSVIQSKMFIVARNYIRHCYLLPHHSGNRNRVTDMNDLIPDMKDLTLHEKRAGNLNF